MKNILLFLLMGFTSLVVAQPNFKLNVLSTVDHAFSEELDRSGGFSEEFVYKRPLGYSLDIAIESGSGGAHSLLTGIRYTKRNLYPDLEIAFWYGGYLSYDADTIFVQTPRMKSLSYELLSIPIAHKRYFKLGEKFSLYTQMGVLATISLSKEESFEDNFNFRPPGSMPDRELTAKKRQFDFYGTSVEVGAGMTYKMNERLALLINSSAYLLEFRRSNDQLVTAWPEGGYNKKVWNKDHFLPIGQVALGLGMQWTLGSL